MGKVGGGKSSDRFSGAVRSRRGLVVPVRARGLWRMRCIGPNGLVRWDESWENIVVNQGLDYLLDVALSAGAAITAWYLALVTDGEVFAAGDTYASHAGWTEFTGYSEAARPQWVDAGVSGQSVSNSASPAVFSITSAGTIGGAALVSNSTKGDTVAAGAKMYAEGAFGAAKSVANGDTLEVTTTFTMGDDGV